MEREESFVSSHDFRRLLGISNKIFLLASFLFVGYTVYELFFVKQDIKTAIQQVSVGTEAGSAYQFSTNPPKPYSYYSSQFASRDLFESPLYQPGKEDSLASSGSPDTSQSLKIVGIILGKTPEVIIEDRAANETFFLHEGDLLRDAVVQKIEDGKVILDVHGQKTELVP